MPDDAGNPLAQVLGRLGLSGEQVSFLQQQLGRVMPSEQLKLMRDLVDTFSPSGDQLTAIRRQLEVQRVQVEDMDATVARLADTAEQLRAMQEPFQRLTHLFNPGAERQ